MSSRSLQDGKPDLPSLPSRTIRHSLCELLSGGIHVELDSMHSMRETDIGAVN